MARDRELASIDDQLRRMWQLYRHWLRHGAQTPTAISPVEALKAIDDLLEQRHELALRRQGELVDAQDRASTAEWGSADTGTAA